MSIREVNGQDGDGGGGVVMDGARREKTEGRGRENFTQTNEGV